MFNKLTAEIYNKEQTDDALGLGYVNNYVFNKYIYGYLDYLSGSDKFIFDKFKQETTHIFIILDKQEVLNTEQIFKYLNDYYLILNVDYPVQANQTEILLKFVGSDLIGD